MFVIFLYEVSCKDQVSWLLCVIAFRASLPLDEVLEHSQSSMTSMVSNLLHFEEFFSSNKVRWGLE